MPSAKLTLHDVELRSLNGVELSAVAAEMARFRMVASAETAREMLVTTPVALARYVGPGPLRPFARR